MGDIWLFQRAQHTLGLHVYGFSTSSILDWFKYRKYTAVSSNQAFPLDHMRSMSADTGYNITGTSNSTYHSTSQLFTPNSSVAASWCADTTGICIKMWHICCEIGHFSAIQLPFFYDILLVPIFNDMRSHDFIVSLTPGSTGFLRRCRQTWLAALSFSLKPLTRSQNRNKTRNESAATVIACCSIKKLTVFNRYWRSAQTSRRIVCVSGGIKKKPVLNKQTNRHLFFISVSEAEAEAAGLLYKSNITPLLYRISSRCDASSPVVLPRTLRGRVSDLMPKQQPQGTEFAFPSFVFSQHLSYSDWM